MYRFPPRMMLFGTGAAAQPVLVIHAATLGNAFDTLWDAA